MSMKMKYKFIHICNFMTELLRRITDSCSFMDEVTEWFGHNPSKILCVLLHPTSSQWSQWGHSSKFITVAVSTTESSYFKDLVWIHHKAVINVTSVKITQFVASFVLHAGCRVEDRWSGKKYNRMTFLTNLNWQNKFVLVWWFGSEERSIFVILLEGTVLQNHDLGFIIC